MRAADALSNPHSERKQTTTQRKKKSSHVVLCSGSLCFAVLVVLLSAAAEATSSSEVTEWGLPEAARLSAPNSEAGNNGNRLNGDNGQGKSLLFNYFDDDDDGADVGSGLLSRHGRQVSQPAAITTRILAARLIKISKDVSYDDHGVVSVLRGKDITLRVHGLGLNNGTQVKLTTSKAELGEPCKSDSYHAQTRAFELSNCQDDGLSGELVILGDELPSFKDKDFFFCLKGPGSGGDGETFIHQGTDGATQIIVYEMLLPIWLMIILLVILLCLSGLFSGLNLGLMALDQTELKIVQNTGTKKEKSYANKIAPIRAHGNFLLCSLLLGNVLVNNTLTILLDTLTSGLVAVIGATMGIVIFGEIIPQAICSRHGLAVGAYTIWLTKFFMLLTFPLSFPISKLLDKLLGAEIGTVYDKKKLIELLRVTDANNDLEKEEADIVTGALMYKDKTVKNVMTKLEDVYMLPLDAVLDFDTVAEIRDQGYSRIPIYDGKRDNIVHILFAKDLMFVDPDDRTPMTTVCEFYDNEVNNVFHDTPLNVMFNEFKSGEKGHMAFVQHIENSGDGDPYYETIGLVTLEDIIEEIIQQEIVDETDVITDNRTKKKRRREGFRQHETTNNFGAPVTEDKRRVAVSSQLTLAVFQYLTTSIEPFKSPRITDSVLKKLLTLDVFRMCKIKKDKSKMDDEDLVIIQKGKPIDYFVLIIEGRVEVNIGSEGLIFESGPFTFFGIQSLTQVMELSPSSPMLTHVHKSATTSQMEGGIGTGPRGSLRKASTHNAIEVPTALTASSSTPATGVVNPGTPVSGTPNNVVKRHASITAQDIVPSRQGSSTFSGANAHLPPFVPDYSVRATQDTLYLRIRKSTYLAALRATRMFQKQSNNELNERELDRLLERVNEHEDDPAIMMNTPTLLRSPERQVTSQDRDAAAADSALRKNGAKYLLERAGTKGSGSGEEGNTLVAVSGSGNDRHSSVDRPDSPPFIDVVGSSLPSTGSNGPGSLPPAAASNASNATLIAVRGNSDQPDSFSSDAGSDAGGAEQQKLMKGGGASSNDDHKDANS